MPNLSRRGARRSVAAATERSSSVRRARANRLRQLVVASVAVSALFMGASASAEASWQPPGTADSRWHCSGYNKGYSPIWFQDCVIVTPSPSGAYVQSVLAVSNTASVSYTLVGMTRTFVGASQVARTDCGSTTIAAHARKWCWGATTYVAGHGRQVFGEGWVGSLYVRSPTWTT